VAGAGVCTLSARGAPEFGQGGVLVAPRRTTSTDLRLRLLPLLAWRLGPWSALSHACAAVHRFSHRLRGDFVWHGGADGNVHRRRGDRVACLSVRTAERISSAVGLARLADPPRWSRRSESSALHRATDRRCGAVYSRDCCRADRSAAPVLEWSCRVGAN